MPNVNIFILFTAWAWLLYFRANYFVSHNSVRACKLPIFLSDFLLCRPSLNCTRRFILERSISVQSCFPVVNLLHLLQDVLWVLNMMLFWSKSRNNGNLYPFQVANGRSIVRPASTAVRSSQTLLKVCCVKGDFVKKLTIRSVIISFSFEII